MKKISAGLVMFVVVTTFLVFLGINIIDSMVSVIVSQDPQIIESEIHTLSYSANFSFGYHFALLCIVVGYVLAIGGILWYADRKDEKKEEKGENNKTKEFLKVIFKNLYEYFF